ncbi:MAG: amino acid transporter [Acidobacteria bacterium]|nr:MAG: amino acid transporter [Acidobacteriota bacterium]
MVGAGIFSILGVVASVSGNAIWISFLVGGIVALLSTYSYSRLGVTFPSTGGAVEFLVRGLGDGLVSGGLNIFMWVGYIVTIALYANAFGSYGATFFDHSTWIVKTLAVVAVLAFTLVNFVGAQFMGRAETAIVAVKLSILLLFAIAGMFFIEPSRLDPGVWPDATHIFAAAGILFVGYEGFGLITNAAGDMANPARTLPRALYTSVVLVIALYMLVSIAVIGNLPLPEILEAEDYALAEAARPFLGMIGFKLVAVAALLSTSSAINATLFGGANVSYTIAKYGQLPETFSRRLWHGSLEGLLLTSAIVIVFVLAFDLGRIAMMGSAAFLVVYAAVNAAHLRITEQTGAKRWIVVLSLVSCLAMLTILSVHMFQQARASIVVMIAVLVGSFVIEAAYRRTSRRANRSAIKGR